MVEVAVEVITLKWKSQVNIELVRFWNDPQKQVLRSACLLKHLKAVKQLGSIQLNSSLSPKLYSYSPNAQSRISVFLIISFP